MSTLTTFTVSDILQKIADLRGEADLDTSAARIRAVSDAERDYVKRKNRRIHYIKDQTITSSGSANETIGSTTYQMRDKGLAEVFVGGTTEDKRYEVVDFNVFKSRFNENNSDRLAYEWYDQASDLWKVHISPTPTASDVITYSYYFIPAVRTATTDRVLCPNKTLIAKLALADIYDGEDEGQKAILQKQEAEQLIAEEDGVEVMPGVNQLYNFGRPSGKRRMGTY